MTAPATSPAATHKALVERMAGFRHDPLGYVLYAFPWGQKGTALADKHGPRKWQREILERIGTKLRAGASVPEVIRESVVSGHGVGKSALLAWLVKWALDTCLDARVVVTANTEKQLQTKTWPELGKWHQLSVTQHWFTFTATALYSADETHQANWRADAVPWSENNTEAFAGLHNEGRRILLVFDEASKIADKVWEVADGALTDENTEILWIVCGNGTQATGRFRECFRRFRHRWTQTHIDAREVEGTNKKLHEEWVKDYGEDSDFVKVRVRGMFPSASIRSFISEADVDPAFGRHLRPDQYDFAPVILSCDPAWEGDDMLVISKRQGLASWILREIPKNDNDIWIANELARLEDEHKADAVFVDGGYGTGIVSAGRAMGRGWTLVWFAEKSFDPGYRNKRAEMWGLTKKWLKEGGSIPKHDQLREDLLGPETKPTLDGVVQLESKQDMKKRGLRSPNYADALVLTFAHPVAHKIGSPLFEGQAHHSLTDWDPFTSTT